MILNAIILALGAIRRNTLRSFLTILGIVIGVAAVIVISTLGKGATAKVTEQISSMGSNMLMIRSGGRMGPGKRVGAKPFTVEDVEALSTISLLQGIAPVAQSSAIIIYGNENWSSSIIGSNNDYLQVANREIEQGRQFFDHELSSGAAVCIIGETIKKNLFGMTNPIGETIRLGKKAACRVIGLVKAKGQGNMGNDQDEFVLIPIKTLHRRFAGNRDIRYIQVSVKDGEDTTKAQEEIEWLMRERRHIVSGKEDDFHVMDMKEIIDTVSQTTTLLTMLLSAIAGISLLVGGIGIMNIMLVSVTERTREIGTRLAIGALEREVLLQFLIESIVLSLFGGLCGIILGLGISFMVKDMLQLPFILDFNIMCISFLFSATIGVIFGYFPALKASRLDPIEALRHE
jgi:putative ABC transport system permease protein